MDENKQLGNNAAARILSVLDNDAKWYHYIPSQFMGIVDAGLPLATGYLDSIRIGKEIAKYNKNLPSDQRLPTRNNDKYFHQRAMYQAAENGIMPALVAALSGEIKEYIDASNGRKEGKSEEDIQKERKKDLKNNYEAIRMALEDGRPVDQVILPNPTIVSYREKKKNGEI